MARTNIADVFSMRVLDANGDPVSGGKVRVYEAGTTTDVTLHDAESAGSTIENPIIADSAGRIDNAFCDSQKIKIVVLDASDVELASYDHLDATGEDDESGFVDLTSAQTITGTKTMDIVGNARGIEDANNNEILEATATTGATNHIGITNSVTTVGPTLSAAGTDTDIDLNLAGKGTGLPSANSLKIGGDTVTGIADTSEIAAATSGKLIDAAALREAVRAALNTQQTHVTTAVSYTSGTEVHLSDVDATITPSSTSANVMIEGTITLETGANATLFIKREISGGATTEIGSAPTAGSNRNEGHIPVPFDGQNTSTPGVISFKYVDSPSTTSATTYSFHIRAPTSTASHLNMAASDADTTDFERGTSTIILSEC